MSLCKELIDKREQHCFLLYNSFLKSFSVFDQNDLRNIDFVVTDNLFLQLPRDIIIQWLENHGNGFIRAFRKKLHFQINQKPIFRKLNYFSIALCLHEQNILSHFHAMKCMANNRPLEDAKFLFKIEKINSCVDKVDNIFPSGKQPKHKPSKTENIFWTKLSE